MKVIGISGIERLKSSKTSQVVPHKDKNAHLKLGLRKNHQFWMNFNYFTAIDKINCSLLDQVLDLGKPCQMIS